MDAEVLQQIRDKILGVTGVTHGGLTSELYLQEIRDAILSVTGGVFGCLNDAIYLQQIRDAILGVTAAPGTYGNLASHVYLQQIRDAYLGVTSNPVGSQDDGIYLGEILSAAGPAGPQYETPAYTNAGGTGDRTASLVVTTNLVVHDDPITVLVNGDTTSSTLYIGPQNTAGKYIKIDFGHLITMEEFKFYSGSIPYDIGVWKNQVSVDDVAYTDVGSNYPLFTAIPEVIPCVATGFRYLQLLGVSGNTNSSPYIKELEFKLGNPL